MENKLGRVSGSTVGNNLGSPDRARLLQVRLTSRDDVQTVQLVEQHGEESAPCDNALVTSVSAGSGCKMAVGVSDRIAPVLSKGGKRIYSTDALGTTVMAEVRLDPDGKVTVTNPGGSISITPLGVMTVDLGLEMVLNVPKVTVNGELDVRDDVKVAGKPLLHHEHSGGSIGSGTSGEMV